MSVWNLTKYFLISKPFWLLSMHTATSLLSRYTACFILKLLSKIAILTGTNYSRYKQKYDFSFFLSSENLGYLTLWSKPVIFPSCALIHSPLNLCVVSIYLFYDHNNLKQRNPSKNAHAQTQKCSKSHFTVFSLSFVSTRPEWAGRRSSIIHFLRENDFGMTKGN